ncbi:lytic murein transglycosylase [Salmonella enterica subsp. enterica serovar Virchow]|nr:lytic murein transglycosylase [Salmonella enterica subsp. enterica serovar Virchow]
MTATTPLCPAGHLPLKGGDQPSRRLSPIIPLAAHNAETEAPKMTLLISPLEGEISAKPTEGGEQT